MTTLFSSTFPGTYGDSLDNNGEGWSRLADYTAYLYTYSNTCRQSNSLPSAAAAGYTRPSIASLTADHAVSVDLVIKSLFSDTNSAGVIGRSSTSVATFYTAYYQPNLSQWRLSKRVANAETLLGSVSATLTAGNRYRVTLKMVGNQISMLVNGVEVVAPVTDNTITAANQPGLRRYDTTATSDTTGIHYENFSVDTLDAGSPDATATGGTGTSTGSGYGGDAVGASGGDVTVTGGTGTGTGSGSGGDATGESAATGTFAAGPLENSPGSQWLNQAVVWTWTPSGRVGSMAGKTPVDGTGTTHATTGILTVSGLTAGAGKLDISVLGATTADDIVYTQYGTVS